MVEKKPSSKPNTPATAATPPAVPSATERRPPLPSLSPLLGEKSVTASTQPVATVVPTATPEKANQNASVPAQPATSPATAKAEEKLGPKLRKRDDILNALRNGGKVEKVDGLFRIVNSDGSKNATSKRRILSLEHQKLVVASADGKSYTLDLYADKKAREPKPSAIAPVAAKSEPSASTKSEAK